MLSLVGIVVSNKNVSMLAFIAPEEVTVTTAQYSRHYLPKPAGANIPLDRVIVDTGGESLRVQKALDELRKKLENAEGSGGEAPETTAEADAALLDGKVTMLGDKALLSWSGFPVRLGRISSHLVGEGLHRHEELAPLPLQLAALVARNPGKRHFRIAVVAAFGTNLGDCLIGMTAIRLVVETLRLSLPGFLLDMLLCCSGNPANVDIVGHEPWVGELHLVGPSVTDFARYDAYFDFTGLIGLPRFNEMPMVDWFLWWSGLDPASVAADRKRNILNISWVAWTQVAELLRVIPGKRVLFNHKASVPLRSFPDAEGPLFAQKLLDLDPELQLVVTSPLKLEHPRLFDLSGKMDSVQKFGALVAQVDALVSVDTFSIHVADAAGVPTVGLFSSVPPDCYPYYPLHHGMLVPGGAELPAFRKCKVKTPEEWEAMKDPYALAWAKVEAQEVLQELRKMMEGRQQVDRYQGLRFYHAPHQPPRYLERPAGRILPFENPSPIWERAVVRQVALMRNLLKPGGTAVVLAPGQSTFPLLLAEKLGREGRVHLFEPRPLRRTLIGMDLLDRAGYIDIFWHDTLPAESRQLLLASEDALCETTPLRWGTLKKQRSITALSVDALELQQLSGLFSFAPTPHLLALESALETLKRTRAPILCSPIFSREELGKIAALLLPLHYQCWFESLEQREDGPMMLLALSDHIKLEGHNMKRIVLS